MPFARAQQRRGIAVAKHAAAVERDAQARDLAATQAAKTAEWRVAAEFVTLAGNGNTCQSCARARGRKALAQRTITVATIVG